MKTWTFGELAHGLAGWHGISGPKRTAFQARLKNFHRLGFPNGFTSSKGKASRYDAAAALQMALAVELTQFGLAPEQVVTLLKTNEPLVALAVRVACNVWLAPEKKPRRTSSHYYLFFDPMGLSNHQEAPGQSISKIDATFGYGTSADVSALLEYTDRGFERLSVLSLTKTIVYTSMVLAHGWVVEGEGVERVGDAKSWPLTEDDPLVLFVTDLSSWAREVLDSVDRAALEKKVFGRLWDEHVRQEALEAHEIGGPDVDPEA